MRRNEAQKKSRCQRHLPVEISIELGAIGEAHEVNR